LTWTRSIAAQLVPVGRDQLPDLALLPVEHGGLLRRLAGAASVLDSPVADAPGDPTVPVIAQPASLLTDDARAALRLLAPFLAQARGTGFAARLPFDLELR
jgi:hypothetical protein